MWRTAATVGIAVAALVGCGESGRRDDLARLPVEQEAADEGGRAQCERPLPPAAPGAAPPAGVPFIAGSVWFARDTTAGSEVRRAHAPAAGPRDAAEELLDQLRRGGNRVEGNNSEEGRATVTFNFRGQSVSAVITPFCEGYVELAYHFPLRTAAESPSPTR